MDLRIILIRTVIRAALAFALTASLVLAIIFLLKELNQADPNPALTALIGGITAYLGTALKDVAAAIASNPSDRGNGNGE